MQNFISAKIVNKETLSVGFLKLFKLKVEQETAQHGSVEYFRELIVRGNAAAILIRDPDTDELVFTRQYRASIDYNKEDPYILDIVAGMVDNGEEPIQSALREAEEESGCQNITNVQQIIPDFYPSSGGCNEKISIFYGEADLSKLPSFKGCKDEHEFIEIVKIPANEAINNLHLFPTSITLLSLLWFTNQRNMKAI